MYGSYLYLSKREQTFINFYIACEKAISLDTAFLENWRKIVFDFKTSLCFYVTLFKLPFTDL